MDAAVADRVRGEVEAKVVGAGDLNAVTKRGAGGRLRWRFRADSVNDVAISVTRRSRWDAARTPVGDRDGDGRPDLYVTSGGSELGRMWEVMIRSGDASSGDGGLLSVASFRDAVGPLPTTATGGAGTAVVSRRASTCTGPRGERSGRSPSRFRFRA